MKKFDSAHGMLSGASINEMMFNHPAFSNDCRIGTTGFTISALNDEDYIEIRGDDREALSKYGIRLVGDPGTENFVFVRRNLGQLNLQINFSGRRDNKLLLVEAERLGGGILFSGNGHLCVFSSPGPSWVNVEFYDHKCGLFWGRGSTAVSAKLHIQGDAKSIQIGDDCLFSWGVDIRTSDGHALVELASRRLINIPNNVIVEPHVWLGFNVSVRKGVTIGAGSVIGSASIVPKSVPSCVAAAGVPSKVIRKGVSWTRSPYPSSLELDGLCSLPYLEAPIDWWRGLFSSRSGKGCSKNVVELK